MVPLLQFCYTAVFCGVVYKHVSLYVELIIYTRVMILECAWVLDYPLSNVG